MARDLSQVTHLPDRRTDPGIRRVRLLLDVDGVINAANPAHAKSVTQIVGVDGIGYTIRIGDRVLAAIRQWADHPNVDLMWCSTWQRHANTALAPAFNLPSLPVAVGESTHHAWKVGHARAAVRDGLPLIWLDDTEATPTAINGLADESIGPALGIAPDPDLGLTGPHLKAIAQFIHETTESLPEVQ